MHQNIVSLTRDVTDGQTQHMQEMVNQEFSQRRRIGLESEEGQALGVDRKVGGKLLKCTEKRGTLQEMTGKWGASFQGEKQKKKKD